MGRVISDNFVQMAWALGDRMRERRKEKKISNAMAGWDEDPESVIQEVFNIDRNEGMKLRKIHLDDVAAQAEAREAKTKMQIGTMARIADYLDAADDDPNVNVNDAYTKIIPILKGTLGLDDNEVEYYRGAVNQDPKMLKRLIGTSGDEKPILMGPGTQMRDSQGNLIAEAPFAPRDAKTISVKRGDGGEDVYVFDPASGRFVMGGNTTTPAPTGNPNPGAAGGFLDYLAEVESGDQNIPSAVDGDPAGPGTKSQGHFQITTPTWQDFAPKVGVDLSKYPNAMSAPRDVQAVVAEAIPFNRFGPRTQRMMQERYGPLDGNATIGELAARSGGGGEKLAPTISSPGKPGGGRARQLSDEEVKTRRLDPRYRWQEMPNGETKIIGPAGQAGGGKQTQSIGAKKAHALAVFDKLDEMAATAKQVINSKGLDRITGVMGVFPNFPGGDAANAEAKLNKLKSQVAFNVLQIMRDMSKTGGALGNVSNYEIKTLENNLASLEKAQSADEFRSELGKIVDHVTRMKKRVRDAAIEDGVDFGSGGGGGGGIPSGAINMLKQNPTPQMRKFFDQKYGAGKAAEILGK